MPKHWYDYRPLKVAEEDDPDTQAWKEFNRSLVANRKPYFMKYIYDDVAKELRNFIRNSEAHAMREYRMSVNSLREVVAAGIATDDQREFVENYDRYLPVSDGDCVVNRICHIIESEFGRQPERDEPFDPEMLKSGGEDIDGLHKRQLRDIYRDYIADCQQMAMELQKCGWDRETTSSRRAVLREYYRDLCYEVCSSEAQLCDALIDVCYRANTSKQFVWDICGEQIIRNLLAAADFRVNMPIKDNGGTVVYRGQRYSIKSVKVEEAYGYNTQ